MRVMDKEKLPENYIGNIFKELKNGKRMESRRYSF